ncbi:MAG: glycosyltransferase family 9 protein, partial [Desulfatiglandales bacterium]
TKYILASLQESGLDIKPDHVRSIIRKGLLKYNSDAPIVLYHLGSGSPKKNLDLSIWLKIKQSLGTMFPDKKHLFVIGPDEAETKEKIKLMFPTEELFYSHSLEQLTDLLQKTYLYVGHDSGPTHYSALLGIPTLALFRWSSVKIWRPLGRAVKVLRLLPRIDPLKAIPKTVSKFFQGSSFILP